MPVPLAPEPTVTQLTGLIDVQVHDPPEAVTEPDKAPPCEVAECDVGETVNVQEADAWFTVTAWPAIVIVPLRGLLAVFAAA